MTNRPESLERSVMRSSVIPSLKYSCSGSPLRLIKGSTAMEGLSGNGRAEACSEENTPEEDGERKESCRTATIPPRMSTSPNTAKTPLCQYCLPESFFFL